MRDTTVEVSKLTQVGDRFYRGGKHVVTASVADELVKAGNAKILGVPAKDAPTENKPPVGAKGDKNGINS